MVSITGTSSNSKIDPTDTTSNSVEYYLDDPIYIRGWDELEKEYEAKIKKEEGLQCKEGWFIPKNVLRKPIIIQNNIKRTIRNCLPRKIRID